MHMNAPIGMWCNGTNTCVLQVRAVELRNLLSGLGPSFVKIGQALSSRPDLLPQAYLDVLADLQVSDAGMPSSQDRALLLRCFDLLTADVLALLQSVAASTVVMDHARVNASIIRCT